MQTITLSTVVFLATIFVTFVTTFIALGNMLAQYILG
jgi:hypothetical protein